MSSSSETIWKFYEMIRYTSKTEQLIVIFYWKKKYSGAEKAIFDVVHKDRVLHRCYIHTYSGYYFTISNAPFTATVLGSE